MIAGHAKDLDEPWPVEGWDSVDVLHLHWPYSLYKAPDLFARVSRCQVGRPPRQVPFTWLEGGLDRA